MATDDDMAKARALLLREVERLRARVELLEAGKRLLYSFADRIGDMTLCELLRRQRARAKLPAHEQGESGGGE